MGYLKLKSEWEEFRFEKKREKRNDSYETPKEIR